MKLLDLNEFILKNDIKVKILETTKEIKGKIKCTCLKCEHVWYPYVGSIKKKCGCPKCANTIKLTNENVDDILKNKNLGIVRIDLYENARKSMTWKCTTCQNTFKTSWDNVVNQNKKGCGCRGGIFLLTTEYAKKTYSLEKRQIEIITLKPRKDKSTFKCLTCDNTWDALKSNVLRHKNPAGCPTCRFKRQRMVGELLRKYFPQTGDATLQNYKVVCPEFRINLLGKRAFVDFKLTYNNSIYFIEYNGEQHYRPVCFGFKTEEQAIDKFKNQILRDEALIKYTNENNIQLVTLPYTLTDNQLENTIKQLKNNSDSTLCLT